MSNQIAVVRKVTVYNTSAQNNRVIESSAMTWGELQQELERSGIPYSGMRAVVGENQNELVTGQSHLMEGDMTLFLMPRRVKSGIDTETYVDPEDGVSFSDIEWNDLDNDPRDYTFKSLYDAGMAFLAHAKFLGDRMSAYIETSSAFLSLVTDKDLSVQDGNRESENNIYDYEEEAFDDEDEYEEEQQSGDDWGFQTVTPVDPETAKLRDLAEQLQRNMEG